MALLESMAAGVPVISTKVGGIPDLIDHGHNGFLIEAGDIDSLSNFLKKLLTNGALGKMMGTRAKETVVREFSEQTVVPRLNDIYSSLVSRRLTRQTD